MCIRDRLSKDEIQKLYLDYSNSFAVSDFDKTVEDIRTTVKHYYSCYPLVFQMCVLLLNHYLLAKTQKLQTELLHYMKDLCDHIIAHCADLNLCKDTLILKALILMGGGQYKEALQIPVSYTHLIIDNDDLDVLSSFEYGLDCPLHIIL